MIKERTTKVKEFLKTLINNEMSSEDLEKYQGMISELDEAEKEEDSYKEEISSCKDQIVSLVKSQGSATPPQNEPAQPRSLEEIANAITGGK